MSVAFCEAIAHPAPKGRPSCFVSVRQSPTSTRKTFDKAVLLRKIGPAAAIRAGDRPGNSEGFAGHGCDNGKRLPQPVMRLKFEGGAALSSVPEGFDSLKDGQAPSMLLLYNDFRKAPRGQAGFP